MSFKYFEKPELFVELEPEKACDICKQKKPCFDAGMFAGTDELEAVCPGCLADGMLITMDIFTCDGDINELKRQLKELNPAWSESEIEADALRKTIELEKKTPYLITWQDWLWPCADGDYCRFIGYGSKPLYQELAKDYPVAEFFQASFYDKDFYDDYLWTDVLPETAVKNYNDSEKYGTLFYVFKSLSSDKIVTVWDAC
jgi:uncharacterized protein CbrC (UPF0167 family)